MVQGLALRVLALLSTMDDDLSFHFREFAEEYSNIPAEDLSTMSDVDLFEALEKEFLIIQTDEAISAVKKGYQEDNFNKWLVKFLSENIERKMRGIILQKEMASAEKLALMTIDEVTELFETKYHYICEDLNYTYYATDDMLEKVESVMIPIA